MILLKNLKFSYIDTDLKIILLDHQFNYVEKASTMSNAIKSFNILSISLSSF